MLHSRLALPLLVTLIRADDADHASALDDLAVFAKLFYGRANFHKIYCSFNVMQPWDKSKGDISNLTRSPGPKSARLDRIRADRCANNRWPFDSSTRHNVLGNTSITRPSTLMSFFRNTSKSPAPIPSLKSYVQNGRIVDHL